MTDDQAPDNLDDIGAPNGTAPSLARHSLTRNLVAMGSSQALSWVLGLVTQIVQPRFLGPDGLGQIQLAFSLWFIVHAVVDLGTGVYLTLTMARDRERGTALVGPILCLRFVAFLVSAVCMAAYAALVGFDRQMAIVLSVTGLTMLVNILGEVFSSAMNGLEQMSYGSIAFIVSKLAYVGVMVIVLTSGGGVIALAWTTTLQAALAFVILFHFYRRLLPIRFAAPPNGYRKLVRASAGLMASGIILVLYSQVDMVVMSLLTDEDALGWYTAADVLRSSIGFVPALIIGVLFPMIGRLHVSDTSAASNIVRQAFWILALTGVSMGFGVAAVGEPIAVLLFGEDFRPAGEVLAVFGLSLPLMFLTMLLGQAAIATGQEWFMNKVMIIAIVMSIAFDIVFVPLMERRTGNGATGGALGYIVTEAFIVVAVARRTAPGLSSRESVVKMIKIAIAGAVMFAAVWPVRELFLLIPVAVGALAFGAAVFVLRILSDEDLYLVQRLASRLGLRVPWTREGRNPFDAEDVPESDESNGA